jgi:hypothetical protein
MALLIRTTGIEDYLASGQANVKCMIVGEPGVGKSVGAAFWPKPIFLHCDQKPPLSLARYAVPLADIKSQQDMDIVLAQLEADNKKPLADRRFRTAVIDTMDAYQNLVIQDRLKMTHKESLSGFEDWGYLDAKMKAMFTRLMALDMNVIINVHLKTFTTGKGDDQISTLGLKIKGDLRDVLPSECNLIGYMHTEWEAQGEGDDRKRAIARYIQWGQTPEFPVLRDDTNTLPFKTKVNFHDSDYELLWTTMFGDDAGMDDMAKSTVVAELEEPPTPEVVQPMAGGPVQPKVHTEPAGRPAAKKAAPATAPAALRTDVPAAAKPTAGPAAGDTVEPPAVAPASVASPEVASTDVPTVEEPAAAVQDEPAPAEPEATTPVVTEGSELEMATEVEQPSPAAEAATGQAVVEQVLGGTVIDEAAVAAQAEADVAAVASEPETAPAAAVPHCGDKARPDGPDPKPGCGRPLTGLTDVENAQVNIAVMKHKTKLCPACLQAANAAA